MHPSFASTAKRGRRSDAARVGTEGARETIMLQGAFLCGTKPAAGERAAAGPLFAVAAGGSLRWPNCCTARLGRVHQHQL